MLILNLLYAGLLLALYWIIFNLAEFSMLVDFSLYF